VGFSPEWLALREPSDLAARDQGLLHAAVAAAGPKPIILDVGCGTGSTARALAPHLPPGTQWRLVDNDPDLLSRASVDSGYSLSTHCVDIREFEQLPLEGATLVTASALLDLVSKEWLLELASRIRVPLYLALSYDGSMQWSPEEPFDGVVTEAFNRHQQGDKGFGKALGPDAGTVAQTILENAGFDVDVASSPWQLGPEDAALQRALIEGIAQAAAEAGEVSALSWGAKRIEAASHSSCTIGHVDILAIPRGQGARDTDALS
jgi:trans-aconitate methyltransferase